MQNRRDSSVWRSLAASFGNGVAFGVGVKITQDARRPLASALSVLSGRVGRIERWIAAMESAPEPAALPAPIRQEALDRAVHSLDGQLRAQAGAAEERLAALESRLVAGLETLERQDQSLAAGIEGRLQEIQSRSGGFASALDEAAAVAGALDQQLRAQAGAVEERLAALESALTAGLQTLERQHLSAAAGSEGRMLEIQTRSGTLEEQLRAQAGAVEDRLSGLESRLAADLETLERQDQSLATGFEARLRETQALYEGLANALREAMTRDLEALCGQIAQLRQDAEAGLGAVLEERLAASAAARMEARFAAMLAERDRETADLRRQLADNEETVLQLVVTIGRMRRQSAGPIPDAALTAAPSPAGGPAPDSVPAPEPPAAPEPPQRPAVPGLLAPFESVAAIPSSGHAQGQSRPDPLPVPPSQRPGRPWHLPLDSTFPMLAAAALCLLPLLAISHRL